MNQVQSALSLLGKGVEDVITGFIGVVVSVSFDSAGCIMALVSPPVNKEGKLGDTHWFDVKRLKPGKQIVPTPNFVDVPGGVAKPPLPSGPGR